jgi:hypothetical protein
LMYCGTALEQSLLDLRSPERSTSDPKIVEPRFDVGRL